MSSDLSRRKFLGNMSFGAAAAGLPQLKIPGDNAGALVNTPKQIKLSSVSIMDISANDSSGMVQQVLAVMENIVPFQPDIICLPEIFAYANLNGSSYQLKEVAEKVPGPVVTPFLNFAARHRCYIICPTYSLHEDGI